MSAPLIPFPAQRRHPPRLVSLSVVCRQFGFSERWFRYRLAEGMRRTVMAGVTLRSSRGRSMAEGEVWLGSVGSGGSVRVRQGHEAEALPGDVMSLRREALDLEATAHRSEGAQAGRRATTSPDAGQRTTRDPASPRISTTPSVCRPSPATSRGSGQRHRSTSARAWARRKHRGSVPAVRAMFGDAARDGLTPINPFAGLRLPGSRGREGHRGSDGGRAGRPGRPGLDPRMEHRGLRPAVSGDGRCSPATRA